MRSSSDVSYEVGSSMAKVTQFSRMIMMDVVSKAGCLIISSADIVM